MSHMPRNRLTAPIAGIVLLAGGVFLYGQKSVFGGDGQPSKGNRPTPSSMKSSPPDEAQGDSSGSGTPEHGKKHVSQGTDSSKKGKEAFQEAVKGTRSATPEQAMDNRQPGKERMARHGN